MRNSRTLLALESSQSAKANLSFGFAAFRNFPPMNLSVLDANPSPPALNPVLYICTIYTINYELVIHIWYNEIIIPLLFVLLSII